MHLKVHADNEYNDVELANAENRVTLRHNVLLRSLAQWCMCTVLASMST